MKVILESYSQWYWNYIDKYAKDKGKNKYCCSCWISLALRLLSIDCLELFACRFKSGRFVLDIYLAIEGDLLINFCFVMGCVYMIFVEAILPSELS